MAYATGSVASTTELKSVIETFAQANGYTLASGILHDGVNGVRLTSEDSNQRLRIEAANSTDFLTGECVHDGFVWIHSSSWPVTYYAFAHLSPSQIIFVIKDLGGYCQYVGFGNIEKIGTWTGGNWAGASIGYVKGAPPNSTVEVNLGPFSTMADTVTVGNCPAVLPAPLWSNVSAPSARYGIYFDNGAGDLWQQELPQENMGSRLHAEIDGYTWPGQDDDIATADALPCSARWMKFLHAFNPSKFNSMSVLTPWYLFMPRVGGGQSLIGRLAHVRLARVDYFAPGSTYVLGNDTWMMFPFWGNKIVDAFYYYPGVPEFEQLQHNALDNFTNSSGPYGWAIRVS